MMGTVECFHGLFRDRRRRPWNCSLLLFGEVLESLGGGAGGIGLGGSGIASLSLSCRSKEDGKACWNGNFVLVIPFPE